jgi:hypothetical protein
VIVVRPLDLAGQAMVSAFNLGQVLLEKLWRLDTVGAKTIADREEGLKPEIKPRHFTGRGNGLRLFHLERKAQVQVIQRIPLDCDRLDVANQWPIVAKFIGTFANLNLAAVQQFPASLFQSVALELGDFAEGWRGSLKTRLEVTEEKLIPLFDSLDYILKGLRWNRVEPGILGQSLEFGQVLHQGVLVEVLASQPVVSLVKGNTMIVGPTCQIDGLMQVFILFASEETILVC